MKQGQTQQLPSSIDVVLYNQIIATVILTSSVPRIAEKYDLSPMMIEEMGKFTGGYPMIDMRVVEGLVKRRIMKTNGELTATGRRICNQMFAVMGKRQ